MFGNRITCRDQKIFSNLIKKMQTSHNYKMFNFLSINSCLKYNPKYNACISLRLEGQTCIVCYNQLYQLHLLKIQQEMYNREKHKGTKAQNLTSTSYSTLQSLNDPQQTRLAVRSDQSRASVEAFISRELAGLLTVNVPLHSPPQESQGSKVNTGEFQGRVSSNSSTCSPRF